MKILKFGGSSLADTDRLARVVEIIKAQQENEKTAVVVSAFGKVTDQLIAAARQASEGNGHYVTIEQELEQRHLQIIRKLISSKHQSGIITDMFATLNDLHDVLHGVYLVREISPRVLDFVMSFGERLSAFILSRVLNEQHIKSEFLDARKVIKSNERFGSALVQMETTTRLIRKYFEQHKDLQVITGFIASTPQNETTTLGRSGSDFTASIFGAALKAREIQIWTDVDGFLTADPRKVPQAFTISSLSYDEAMELSHFGAHVVHPSTMQPALDNKIPIRVKNTLNPAAPGTLIHQKSNGSGWLIKGLSSIDEVALISVIGSGMLGETGIAGRIFSALARNQINIILITQASSEHSVCFAVRPEEAAAAKSALEEALRLQLIERRVNKITVEKNLALIAVVGEHMRRTKGIAGRVFSALGDHDVNIVAIAQGSSELNISMAVKKNELSRALQAIHHNFFEKK